MSTSPEPSFIHKKNMGDWSTSHVQKFLKHIGLEAYQSSLAKVDGEALVKISDKDLRDMGVSVLAHRKKLLKERDGLIPEIAKSPPKMTMGEMKVQGKRIELVEGWKEENKKWITPVNGPQPVIDPSPPSSSLSTFIPHTPTFASTSHPMPFFGKKITLEFTLSSSEVHAVDFSLPLSYRDFKKKLEKKLGPYSLLKYRKDIDFAVVMSEAEFTDFISYAESLDKSPMILFYNSSPR
jgi:hypothetical protein